MTEKYNGKIYIKNESEDAIETSHGTIREGSVVAYSPVEGITVTGEVKEMPPLEYPGQNLTFEGMVAIDTFEGNMHTADIRELQAVWETYEDYQNSFPPARECLDCGAKTRIQDVSCTQCGSDRMVELQYSSNSEEGCQE